MGYKPLSFGQLFEVCAQVSGLPRIRFKVPSRLVRLFWPLMAMIEKVIPVPDMFSGEAVRSVGTTWIVSCKKAQAELGWQPRPVEAGLRLTFDWLNQKYNQSAQ
jgi:nucleoside-diphosphate-sugar epimerase